MHHFPRIFAQRKQSKSMDNQILPVPSPPPSSSSSPSSRPKLERKNAMKNPDFTPSPSAASSVVHSSSSSSTVTSTSSAPRTRSLDLNPTSDRSLRIEGNAGQLGYVCHSLGLQGPEDFEIPMGAWDMFRQSSGYSQHKSSQLDFDDDPEPSERRAPELQSSVDNPSCSVQLDVQASQVFEPPNRQVRLNDDYGYRGLNGDRPPSLTPPPLVSFPGLERAPSNIRESEFRPSRRSISSSDEDDGNSPSRDETSGAILDFPVHQQSATSSFMSSHDDDSSSTTTDRTSDSPNGCCRIKITNWQKGNPLGKGSFGTVYEGYSTGGTFFAIKEVSLLDPGSRRAILSLEQEIELLSKFEHKNIVKYYGTDRDESNLYIFLELVTKGSLANVYSIYALEDSQVSLYTRQILEGLKYLHDQNIVHRDIKCANILVAANGIVKLADFGLAKVSKFNDLKSSQGSPLWMAPEVVNNRRSPGYGTSADIWSLGCTVLEMLTGQPPYYPLEWCQVIYRIGKGELPPIPETLSNDSRDFILKCLKVNPCDRPSADELLHHPFVC